MPAVTAEGYSFLVNVHTIRAVVRERSLECVDRPELCVKVIRALLDTMDTRCEVFGAVALDARNRCIGVKALHIGARTHATVEPSILFRYGILADAKSLVIWHTHPSGDPEPSEDDLALTRQLVAAGKALAMNVLDHVVLGEGTENFVSLRQRGLCC